MTEKMIDLWVLAFGDSREIAEEFFSLGGIDTLTETEGDALAGMASLIPVGDSLGGRGYYVYGVCVAPEYRGQGLFRRLMGRCEEFATERGADYLCLIPTNRGVAEAYRKMGFSHRVSLSPDASAEDARIVSENADFSAFAISDKDFTGADCGLMMPLSEAYFKNTSYCFPERMGEC